MDVLVLIVIFKKYCIIIWFIWITECFGILSSTLRFCVWCLYLSPPMLVSSLKERLIHSSSHHVQETYRCSRGMGSTWAWGCVRAHGHGQWGNSGAVFCLKLISEPPGSSVFFPGLRLLTLKASSPRGGQPRKNLLLGAIKGKLISRERLQDEESADRHFIGTCM